jgi:transposase InsO family protein
VKRCTITGLCRLVGVTRQAYYKGRTHRQRRELDETLIIELVRGLRAQHPRMGSLKLHNELKSTLSEAGVEVGRDRFHEVLRKYDLLVKPKKKAARTTFSDHSLPVYRNLLYQLEPTAANQVWVSDITYIDTDEGFLYLSLVTDLSSRKIVGYNIGETLEARESVKALMMAIEELPDNRWPMHHSDRGSQYCCQQYVDCLSCRNLPISMTEQNHCYENCYAERVNGILKAEYNLDRCFRSKEQAEAAIHQSVHLYNHNRPHRSLNMRKPAEVHEQAA